MSSGDTTNNATTSMQPSLQESFHTSLENNSPAELSVALGLARSKSAGLYDRFRERAIRAAVSRGLSSVTIYLLDEECADLAAIAPHHIAQGVSIQMLDLLLSRGWDLNKEDQSPSFQNQRILDLVLEHEEVVIWLVEHGARVDEGTKPQQRQMTTLERCATHGSYSTFVYLQNHGAKLGRMSLHRAALRGAECGATPMDVDEVDHNEARTEAQDHKRLEAEKILRHLVDKVGLDVNQIENDKPWLYGTPINHAASKPRGAGVVRWLLEKGADPSLYHPQCPGENAAQIARSKKHESIVEVLEKRKQEKSPSPF